MIWQVTTTEDALRRRDEAELATPPRFQWVNAGELRQATRRVADQYPAHEMWENPALAFSAMPTPVLHISDPGFAVEYFRFQTYSFASGRLRQAFGVDDSVARFREVDTAGSAPEVAALGYCAFDVSQFGNPFDPDRTPGELREVRQADGSLRREWIVDYTRPDLELYFREDFVAPAPIFRGVGTLWTFATDEFADRIMRAGVVDMAFMDITGPAQPERPRLRVPR